MARFMLKRRWIFTYALDSASGHPVPVPGPTGEGDEATARIVDKTNTKYVTFNEGAAFIAYYLVQGIDTGIIAQMVQSDYGISGNQANTDVRDVVKKLQDLGALQTFSPQLPYRTPKVGPKNNHRPYPLKFDVSSPLYMVKIPI